MALNAASHNIPGEQTGPVTGQPPSLSDEASSSLIQASEKDPMGQQAPGKDGGDKEAGQKVKSEKELAKERAKAEKAAKFAEKQAKQKAASAGAADAPSKAKEKKKVAKEAPPQWKDETPKGQKKILKPLDEVRYYDPAKVESAWYDWWEAEGYFKPEFKADGNVKDEGYFVIPIPPPNVTGKLHVGHAIATSLQDTLIRWSRMKGLTTLYLPGTDHAGIATQTVVEKMLKRREGKTRHDLGRPEFINRVWQWKGEYLDNINRVLRRLGASFDWTRESFTLSPQLSEAVAETFVRLYEEGYIYRDNKIVNWCGQLRSAISNLEVDNIELTKKTLLSVPGYDRKVEFGVLTHFKYPIDGSDEFLEVATTRPETMLGDTGIAVHPDDKRYTHLVGKKAKHPFVDGLYLDIVADDSVLMDFGTGAVKCTPAHDQDDFDRGKRNKLKFINIYNDDGTLNENGGKFAGQKRFDVRYAVVDELKKAGLFVKAEDNAMKVPICSRSKDVIEPMIKPQWWMKMDELAEQSAEVVRNGEIKIRPQTAHNDFLRWMADPRDWCLSRQLWWGHQIPAYFVRIEGEENTGDTGEYYVCAHTEEAAHDKAKAKFPGKKFTLERDPDVLDTWFSSGLWPFSTLGWPKTTQDFEKLFPTSCLETGYDILFFWVARMIFMSLKLTGKVPFTEVFCHPLIRDSENRKMSKSLGNVIDPTDLIDGIELQALHDTLKDGNLDPKEVDKATKYQKTTFPQGIPQLGTDALRYALVSYTTGGDSIQLDVKHIKAKWSFAQKIYQATAFATTNFGKDFAPQSKPGKTGKEALVEKWMLHKLNAATKSINQALTEREFARSTDIPYHYWYDDLCAIYIENSKHILQNGTEEERRSALETLYTALEGGLTMMHPFMPFVTEELWQRLPRRSEDSTPSIMVAKYPQHNPELDDTEAETAYDLVLDTVASIRGLISGYEIENGKASIHADDTTSLSTIEKEFRTIQTLSSLKMKISSFEIIKDACAVPKGAAKLSISPTVAVYVHSENTDPDSGITKAQKKMKEAADTISRIRMEMDAPEFLEKVSQEAQKERQLTLDKKMLEQSDYERTIEQFKVLKLGK
ncbi:valyl-tRNA synthetase-like protein [Aulographum hederae CBS 113979]|uniref:valine--tRNA ligase n=1 Tax=Aulographum hederae CBS 113979 TaxID=1176131 RepID=A0A6G1GZM4_9PEZI|nr:valyl-tRNA synthetase-like protein [Aulographum hederae CBS 113979]